MLILFSLASQWLLSWLPLECKEGSLLKLETFLPKFWLNAPIIISEEVWTKTIVIAMYCKKVSNFKLVTASTYHLVVTCTILTTFYCACLLFSANLQFPSMDIWSWCVSSMGGKLINYYYSTLFLLIGCQWREIPCTWMAIIHHMKWVILCTSCGMWCWGVTMHTWKSFLEIIMFGFPAASAHKTACPVRPCRDKDTTAMPYLGVT